MEKPKVSIIIPTYNSRENLRDLLRSLELSVWRDFQVIINDDPRSADKVAELVREFVAKGLNIIYLQNNKSIAQARKAGAGESKGEYLLHLDSDMQVSPDLLGECVALADSGLDALVIPEESFGTTFWAKCKGLEKKCINGVEQIESLRFVKKEVYERVGGHDEQMVFSEDKDFDIRVREAGYSVGRTVNIIRHNEGELTLLQTFRKKLKYSATANVFAKAHPEEFHWQMGILNRYRIYLQHKKYFFSHPFLYIGMFFLKAFEFGFIGGWVANMSSKYKIAKK
jgi:glycosyltransferase involved in cell wall biosynthesis